MKTHIYHTLVLVAILGGGVIVFFSLKGDTNAQYLIGVTTSIAYVLWGIISHALVGDLHRKVVIEYLLVGAVAILVLANVLRP